MSIINVQFQDSTSKVVISYFANPQDSGVCPNQGQIDASDPRYASFFNSLPADIRIGMPTPGQDD